MGPPVRREPAPTPGPDRSAVIHGTALYGVVAVICALMLVSDPVLPAGGLDPSWMSANEHAARAGLVFGQGYIFTFGPLVFLSTKLYDTATFAFVIIGDIFLACLLVLPLFRSRGWMPALLYPAGLLLATIPSEPFFVAALLGLFTAALDPRLRWAPVLAALIMPFLFSKYSFALVLLPLLTIVDLKHFVADRRPPMFLPVFVLSAILAQLLLDQPLTAVPQLLGNVGDLIGGYSGTMQLAGRKHDIYVAVAAIAAVSSFTVWLAHGRWAASTREERLRDIFHGIGLFWTIFILVKMSYLRNDGRLATLQVLILAVPGISAYFAARIRLNRRENFVAILLTGLVSCCVCSCLNIMQARQTAGLLP